MTQNRRRLNIPLALIATAVLLLALPTIASARGGRDDRDGRTHTNREDRQSYDERSDRHAKNAHDKRDSKASDSRHDRHARRGNDKGREHARHGWKVRKTSKHARYGRSDHKAHKNSRHGWSNHKARKHDRHGWKDHKSSKYARHHAKRDHRAPYYCRSCGDRFESRKRFERHAHAARYGSPWRFW